MSEVHYFPRYSQRENVVTNNTLLLLLRLHQYNRFKFEKFMEKLCGDQEVQLAGSWLHFHQQKGTGKSVVDGFIAQDSVKIAVETKLGGAFDAEQLEKHLGVFGTEQHKLLILLNPSVGEASAQQLGEVRKRAAEGNIQIVHTTFEDIVANVRSCLSPHEEEMQALVSDFESFCSDNDLLPRDKYTLFVPPCGQSIEDNLEFRLYYCLTSRSVRKAEYLGIYKERCVRAVGRIAKVVSCDVDLEGNSVTLLSDRIKAITEGEQKRILAATREAPKHGYDISRGHKFYLCDELHETNFRKTSPGGIWSHRYLDLEKDVGLKIPSSVSELAEQLRNKTWG